MQMIKLTPKSKKILVIVAAVTAIVVAVIAIGVSYISFEPLLTDNTAGKNGQIEDIYKTPDDVKNKMVNFLVIGIDNDPDLRSDRNMTDVIMIVSCNFEDNQVNILQIPRDTYVADAARHGKINALYSNDPDKWDYNGLKGLIQMIHEMLDITIDHYATIQMDGFIKVIDILGGVTMDVPVDIEVEGTLVEKGVQTLNGKEAAAVVRGRKMYKTADIGRMQTQKIFLSALAEECRNISTSEFLGLLPVAFESISTDLSISEVGGYYKIVRDIDLENMNIMTLPGYPMYTDKNPYTKNGGPEQSVVSIDRNKTAEMLNTYFRPFTEDVPAEELGIIQIHYYAVEEEKITSLNEINGSGKDGNTGDE